MAKEVRVGLMTTSTSKLHSGQLQSNLASAAKALAARPQELRGPFVVRHSRSATSGSSKSDK